MRASRNTLRTLLAALVGLVGVLAWTAAPAAAHDGDAAIAVEAADPEPDGSVHYVVRVTWTDDGHAALDTTVTATPVAGDGTPQTPVQMTAVDQDGRYEATVPFPAPGAWTIRFASIDPNGTVEQAQEVAEPTTTTAAPSTSAADAPTTTEARSGSEAAAASQPSDDDGGGGGSGGLVVGAVVVLLVVAGGVGFWRWRGRQQSSAAGASGPRGEASPAEST
jgi:hypothetical protein